MCPSACVLSRSHRHPISVHSSAGLFSRCQWAKTRYSSALARWSSTRSECPHRLFTAQSFALRALPSPSDRVRRLEQALKMTQQICDLFVAQGRPHRRYMAMVSKTYPWLPAWKCVWCICFLLFSNLAVRFATPRYPYFLCITVLQCALGDPVAAEESFMQHIQYAVTHNQPLCAQPCSHLDYQRFPGP